MVTLRDPITIRGMTIKNRIGFAPCLTGSHDTKGLPTQKTFNHYEGIARGGVGLLPMKRRVLILRVLVEMARILE